MAQTYTRQSSIADGDTITAALFNNEYNQLLNAFAYSSSSASSTGHRHDGTAAQGGNIYRIGDLDFLNKIESDSTNNRWGIYVEVSSAAVEQIRIQDGAIVPVTDNDIDLGTSSLEFKDAYFDGTVTTDALVADTADINGGTVDGATVGANSASSGAFTTITASSSITGSGTVQGTTITATTAFVPDASDGAALGTSALEFSDLFLADGAVINFGDDQDVSLTHVADTGLLLSSTDQLQFGDSGTYIYQSADGVLDLVADTEIEINATTIDINGNVDVSGTLTVAGAVDFGDAALSNVGAVQLDSIAGDGDTNTSITFSGSDVITITAGGDTQFTFNNGSILPTTDNDIDLGSSSYEFKDGYFDGTVYADAINFNGTAIASTAAELNIMDGDTSASSTTLADADRVVVNDNGTMKQVALTDFETYFESSIDTIANFEVTTELQTPLIAFTDGDDAIQIADGGGVTMAAGLTSTAAANSLGATSFNDADITNVGSVQLDSIAGDGDTNTSITFSGSDVITVAAGGDNQVTFTNGAIVPSTDNDIDLGTSSVEFKDAFFDGTVTSDAFAGPLTGDVTGTSSKVTVSDSTANTNFPVVFHDESNALLDDTGALRYNPSTGTLLVPNLSVAGTTTTVDTVTMEASNAIIFEGATADAHETTLSIVDPTGDNTQYLINQGGYIPVLAAVTTTAISSTPAELNVLDGVTAGTVSASLGVVVDSNKDIGSFRNITLTGELDAGSLDVSGDADIDGTLETDALTINGSALNYKAFGTSSIMLGDNATGTIDAANYNTGLGVDVFAALTSGDDNTAVGFAAGDAITTGTDNTFVGKDAGGAITTGGDNTVVGSGALATEDGNGQNVAVGSAALATLNAGADAGNVAVGYQALTAATTGVDNVAVGFQAGDAVTTGSDNTLIGDSAGGALTTGANNVAVGSAALATEDGNGYNVAIGYESLKTLNAGADAGNVAIGYQAATLATTAAGVIAIGKSAGAAITTGGYNTLIGNLSGDAITTGTQNVAVGAVSLTNNTTASYNTALGYNSLSTNTTGAENTGVGHGSLAATTTGSGNTAVGSGALDANTDADDNTAVGKSALGANTTGGNNTAVGKDALLANTTANANTAVGDNAMAANTTGHNNTAIGISSLASNTTGVSNVAVGSNALDSNTTADDNTALGKNSLGANTTGAGNTAVGKDALLDSTTGSENTALGYRSLYNNTTAGANTALGHSALFYTTTGANNVAVGQASMYVNSTGASNSAVGNGSLGSNTTGTNNTAIGSSALYATTTGGYNTAIGNNAGDALTTGSHNIYIGRESDASGTGVEHEIVIGNSTSGKGSNTFYAAPSSGTVYNIGNTTTWNQSSDRRIKKNIVDNNQGLEIINQIRVRNFEYRTVDEIVDFDKPEVAVVEKEGLQIGTIAQEIETVLPQIIKTESTGVKQVDTDSMTWYLINAVKELSTKVEELENNKCKCNEE